MGSEDKISDFNVEVGSNVKRIRELLGLSQREVAEAAALPLSQGRLSDLENGRRDWRPKYIKAVADAMKVPPWALLDFDWDHRWVSFESSFSGGDAASTAQHIASWLGATGRAICTSRNLVDHPDGVTVIIRVKPKGY